MLDTILKYKIDLGYGGRGEELKIVVNGFKYFMSRGTTFNYIESIGRGIPLRGHDCSKSEGFQ